MSPSNSTGNVRKDFKNLRKFCLHAISMCSKVKRFYSLFFMLLRMGTKGSKGTLKLDYNLR